MREAALEVALMRGALAPSLGRRLADGVGRLLAVLRTGAAGRSRAAVARDRRRAEERWPTL